MDTTTGSRNQEVEARKHILCVDDDGDVCDMMTVLLNSEGYNVTTASNMAECIAFVKEGDIDLVILDGSYEDGMGTDLCKDIRAFSSQTPIIFLSGRAYQEDIDNGLAAGAQAYLTKPIEVDLLRKVLTNLLVEQDTYIPSYSPRLP
jgi:DNA-binding response OmpR family regulator